MTQETAKELRIVSPGKQEIRGKGTIKGCKRLSFKLKQKKIRKTEIQKFEHVKEVKNRAIKDQENEVLI